MKHVKAVKLVSNIFFWLGMALSAAALAKTYFDGAGLPAGVCPYDQNRWLIYTALAVLGASLVSSFAVDFLKRRQRRSGNE